MLLLGFLAFCFGVMSGIAFWQRTAGFSVVGGVITMIVPAAMICYALLNFPAALIYFYRKQRGIPTDVWDCETPNDPACSHSS